MTMLNCLLIGNEPLTIECGKRLLEAGHRISAVATTRDQVRSWAESAGLEVVKGADGLAEDTAAVDWLFSVANLEMIPRSVLARATKGAVNFHDGPLPAYAGLNAPVWAILNGETTHGITWHLMEEGADTGDILVTQEVNINGEDTAFTLNAKCFAAGVESFDRVLEEIANGLSGRQAQDMAGRSYFGLKDKPAGAGWIDPAKPAADIARMVRALDHAAYDNPVAAPFVMTANGPILAGEAEMAAGSGEAGSVLAVEAASLTIAVADGALRLSRLRDTLGKDLDPTGMVQAGDSLANPEIDMDAVTASAKAENFWRKRLADYRPADWPARAGEGGAHGAPIEVGDTAKLAAAFGAVIAAVSNGESVDLALMRDVLPGQAPWSPLRYDTGATWAEATDFFQRNLSGDFESLRAPFAADLLARIAEVPRQLPMAGISNTGPIPGVALTLVMGDSPRIEADTSVITKVEVDLIAARVSALLAADVADDTAFAALPLLPEAAKTEQSTAGNDDKNRNGLMLSRSLSENYEQQ